MKPTRNPLFRAAALSAIIVVATQSLHAVDIVWVGTLTAGPYPWNTTTNWTGGNVPNDNTERADLRKDWTAASYFQPWWRDYRQRHSRQ